MRTTLAIWLALLGGACGACAPSSFDETGKSCSSMHPCGPGYVCGPSATCAPAGSSGPEGGDGAADAGGPPSGGGTQDAGAAQDAGGQAGAASDGGRCPAGTVCFIEDTFARSTQTGWGTTTNADGVPNVTWTLTGDGGIAPYLSIQGNTGALAYPAATDVVGIVSAGTGSFAGGDALARVSLSAVGHAMPYISLNACPDDSCYYGLRVHTSLNQVELAKRSGSSTTAVVATSFTAAASTPYWLRLDFDPGTNVLSGKIWADGTPEPSAWTLQFTDGAPLRPNLVGAGGTWDAAGAGELFNYSCYSFAAPGYGPAAPCGQVRP